VNSSDFLFEYLHEPSPDAEEKLAQAWDLILALLLEDYENEQREKLAKDGDTCSTQSE
jgi:hypothetical protein